MQSIKLIASRRPIEISAFNSIRVFRWLNSYRTYSFVCGDLFESGHYQNGVTYPYGKQPYRMLMLIVKDKPKVKTEQVDMAGIDWHINIEI